MGSPFELSGAENLCTALRNDLLFVGHDFNSLFCAVDLSKGKTNSLFQVDASRSVRQVHNTCCVLPLPSPESWVRISRGMELCCIGLYVLSCVCTAVN